MRKLAERTTEATSEIAHMIQTIQEETRQAVAAMQEGNTEVEEGIALADRAGNSLREIVARVQATTDAVSQIAAANEEQSSTSEQIGRSIDSIATATNESADGVAQIATAAEGLNRLSVGLEALVARFRLNAAEADHRSDGPGVSGDGSGTYGLPRPIRRRAD